MISDFRLKFGRSPGGAPEWTNAAAVTVFVGPNNAGNSKVLTEIHEHITEGHPASSNVILSELKFAGVPPGLRPQTPGIYRFCCPEWMFFALLHTAPAVQSKCLIGGQGNAGMRPERRFKPGMDGGLRAAFLVSPPLHLRTAEFLSKRWGPPQKTGDESAESFGAGRCVLLLKPLGRSSAIALVSTTTQRAGQGLAARISYLFDGMRELVPRLADARLNDVVMPILGAGHGRIDTPLAFVGLLLAVAEAAHYGQGGQRLRRVTVVVFKRNADTPAQVDRVIVRRALALIGTRD